MATLDDPSAETVTGGCLHFTRQHGRVHFAHGEWFQSSSGRLAQLVRAPASHAGGRQFESAIAHSAAHPGPIASRPRCAGWREKCRGNGAIAAATAKRDRGRPSGSGHLGCRRPAGRLPGALLRGRRGIRRPGRSTRTAGAVPGSAAGSRGPADFVAEAFAIDTFAAPLLEPAPAPSSTLSATWRR